MDSSNIDNNNLKALAFNKFKYVLYKYCVRFSKISKFSEYLNQFLLLLHDCVSSSY